VQRFTYTLEDSAVNTLRGLLGRPVYNLYTSSLEVDGDRVVAPHYSIPLPGGRFLVVQSDWGDTPREAIDYHVIGVDVSDSPPGVEVGPGEDGRVGIKAPFSAVRLRHGGAAISEVSVRVFEEVSECEGVRYDAAILFEYEGGTQFLLEVNDSISGGLRYTGSSTDIAQVCLRCPERIGVR